MNKYLDKNKYAYIFGAFGTIELLENKSMYAKAVIVSKSFINNEAFVTIKKLCEKNNVELLIDDLLLDKLKDKGNIYVIGIFNKYDEKIELGNHIILDNVNDPGTIGTIIRSMEGFGFSNLVLVNSNVDIFDNHLIRASMGAYFRVKKEKYNSLDEYCRNYSNIIYSITSMGNDISTINSSLNYTLMFNSNNKNYNNILFDKDISLDNKVNIVLFSLYK